MEAHNAAVARRVAEGVAGAVALVASAGCMSSTFVPTASMPGLSSELRLTSAQVVQRRAPSASSSSASSIAAFAAIGVVSGLAVTRSHRSRISGVRSSHQHRRVKVATAARGGAADYDSLVADLEALVKEKGCGPILIRLSWHDAGVFSDGNLKGGCPNAVMRFTDAGEGTFGANAGLPDVAVGLLKPIADKYVPSVISTADLWVLAANVAIQAMGGPTIKTRFGRKDAVSSAESVESQVGRLPDGDKGIDHLREIFHPKGFDDKDIVALSGAHSVGKCHLDRSGFDGAWTEEPLKFDNAYFTEMCSKTYAEETTAKGCPQLKDATTGTIMLISDLALLKDAAFKTHVERYAQDQAAFFADFSKAWIKLQENGCTGLRDSL